ncbi:hypothetical protein ACFL02_00030 [Planctomycetota bacterium]
MQLGEPAPEGAEQSQSNGEALEIDESGGADNFRKDLLRLAIPIRSTGEASTFIIVIILFTAIPFLEIASLFCCLDIIIIIGIWGCLASFFFNILTDAAEGQDQLPYLSSLFTTLLEDFWQGLIVPISNFFGAILYAFVPCLMVSAIYFFTTGNKTPFADWPLPLFIILLAVGIFFVPIVMLALDRNKLTLLFKPIEIFRSMLSVWKPYLVCWFCLSIAVGLALGANFFMEPYSGETLSTTWVLVTLAICILDIWVWIYAMRVIGLLWRHYQHQLGWGADKEHSIKNTYIR